MMAADMDQESLVRRELTSRCIAIVSLLLLDNSRQLRSYR